jgi:general secretion pathway protein F
VQSRWAEISLVLLVAVVAGAGILIAALRRPGPAMRLDRLKLNVPVLGKVVAAQETARFARTLGTLLRAGVPLLQALGSAREVVANRYLAAGMERAQNLVREGARLHRALEDATALPPLAQRMISVGEEAGKLDHMLLRTATMLEQQAERSIDRFMVLLTPILTGVMAVLVGGLMVTVMTAILSVNELAVQ